MSGLSPRHRPSHESPAAPKVTPGLEDAVEALRAAALVIYPTETFYGVGADPYSEKALNALFDLKGRDPEKPVALIAADVEMALALASEVSSLARRLAHIFWPGPLTLVLPARPSIPRELIGPGGGVGVRVSAHPIAVALARNLGRPITATSANLAGAPPATTLEEARSALGGKIKVYLEGGTSAATMPSTVVEIGKENWRMIREGAVSLRQIAAALASGTLE